MRKFEFRVTKIQSSGKIWTHYITIKADNKLAAFAKIDQIFPEPEYEWSFITAC